MITEKYNLITKGELLEGFTREVVAPGLALLFKVDEQLISRIFSNKAQVIVKNITWEQALRYQKKLKSIGLIIYLDVILKAELFRDSLIPVAEHDNVDSSKIPSLQFMIFDNKKLNPIIAYPPQTETIYNIKEIPQFKLQSFNHKINFKFILILSLIASLLIQKYFTMIIVWYFSGPLVTAISIVLFFLVTLLLPKIMIPNRIFTLRESKHDKPCLLCIQNSSYNLFIDSYKIYSPEGDYLATINHNKLKSYYQCIDEQGHVLFTSSEEHNIDDFTKGVTKDLRDELFDFSILAYINSVSVYYKKFKAWIKQQPHEYSREDAYFIRDKNQKKTAYFYRGKNSAIELPENNSDNAIKNKEYTIMMAFLLICVGVD